MTHIAFARILLLVVLALTPLVGAPPLVAGEAEPAAAPAAGKARAEFDRIYSRWKDVLTQLRDLRAQYFTAEKDALPEIRKQYHELTQKGKEMVPKLRQAALAAYLANPGADRQLTRMLIGMARDHMAHARYTEALALGRKLIDAGCRNKDLLRSMGQAAFALHQFADARDYLKAAGATENPIVTAAAAEDYIDWWRQEQQIRAALAQQAKNDPAKRLPRVRLKTTQGDVVIELFEDHAPNTVANFISLVESNFYDGQAFFRVQPFGQVESGSPTDDGKGGPGYAIPDETDPRRFQPRRNFRGSVGMVLEGSRQGPRPNTAGSQFYIALRPLPQLNGRTTVFGRVVEGFEVLGKLKQGLPNRHGLVAESPDRILKAEVIHKRDHAYAPQKLSS